MTIHHHPTKLDKKIQFDREIALNSLASAQYALGLLEGSQKNLENPSLLLSPLLTKEATTSSKIEGTQSTVTDVFAYSVEVDTNSSDAKEVWNYREAMFFAIDHFKNKKPISKSFLKQLHQLLLNDVRRNPDAITGEFRNKSVWIGKEGAPIEQASYVPPEHFLVNDYIEDLMKYIDNDKEKSLIKASIVHYQFEAIHPFDDGNGRIGRLLIPLLLFAEKKITLPILYISGYFEKNKDAYVSALRKVDETGDFTEWIVFFMEAVVEQLAETQKIINSIYELYSELKKICASSSLRYDLDFIDFIFSSPIFTINDVRGRIEMTSVTARSLISDFIEKGYIEDTGILRKRSKVYVFKPLISILG